MHIGVKYLLIRERFEDKTVELQYCLTEIMKANLLSKALRKAKVDQDRQTMMNCSLN